MLAVAAAVAHHMPGLIGPAMGFEQAGGQDKVVAGKGVAVGVGEGAAEAATVDGAAIPPTALRRLGPKVPTELCWK